MPYKFCTLLLSIDVHTNLSVSPVPLMMMILRQPSESPYIIKHSSYPVELKDIYTKKNGYDRKVISLQHLTLLKLW